MQPIRRIRPFLKPKPYNHAAAEIARYEGAKGMSVRSTITSQFEQVAREQKRKLSRLTDDLSLLDSGLDSLSFALVVMHLENALGYDPFDVEGDVKFPVTFGEFVKLYEDHSKAPS
jgi:acyl carrier protein